MNVTLLLAFMGFVLIKKMASAAFASMVIFPFISFSASQGKINLFQSEGFSGDLCNFEYNECDSNPCINGGQCIDRLDQGENFSCKCTKGYQGNRCHIKVRLAFTYDISRI